MAVSHTVIHRGVELRYGVHLEALDPILRSRFVRSQTDERTRAFIDDAHDHPTSFAASAARAAAASWMSIYDANGLVGTHSMHVLSGEQWRILLEPLGIRGALLDVGAGDGGVTAELARVFDRVVAVETSPTLARRLRARGYECVEVDLSGSPVPELGHGAARDGVASRPGAERDAMTGDRFDAVALLNVIDRTPRPLTLLRNVGRLLAPGGALLLATPLPISQAVQVPGGTVDPDEIVPLPRTTWEADLTALGLEVLPSLGYEVLSFTRAPYLSKGDRRRPIWVLDAAILIARTTAGP